MKKDSVTKQLMEELSKTSNISIACKNVGISRQAFYRWKLTDPKFRKKSQDAMVMGIESINDLARSNIIRNIKNGDRKSAEFWLKRYERTPIDQLSTKGDRKVIWIVRDGSNEKEVDIR